MFSIAFMTGLTLSLLGAEPLWPDLSKLPPTTGGGEKDAAVVVAVEDYAYLPDVEGAGDLGVAWYMYLSKVRKVPLVMLLKDADATPLKIRNALEAVASRVKPGGKAWFVFIGHGSPSKDGNDGALVGATAQADQYEFFPHTITRGEVIQELGSAAQGTMAPVLILDACFSGTDVQGKTLITGAQFAVSQELAEMKEATVLTAGRARDIAGRLPGASRPAFSYLVLGALRGWGDADGDGTVTAAEAVQYARDALLTLDSGRQQSPQQSGVDQALTPKLSGNAVEQGPDLAELKMRLSGDGSKGSSDELDRQLAELRKARKAREEAERQEAVLRDAAQKSHDSEVATRWEKVRAVAQEGGPEGMQAVELFLKQYRDHPLGNPKLEEAQQMLIQLSREDSGDELSRQLAELEIARKAREETERREAEALERARKEREEAQRREAAAQKVADQSARKKAEAKAAREAASRQPAMEKHAVEVEQAWNAVLTVARGGGPEGEKAVQLFLKQFKDHPLGNPKEAEALEMLQKLGATTGAAIKGYIFVKAGCFQIGSPANEEGRYDNETRHEVCLTTGFFLKETEVTQREWRELMGDNPSYFTSCGDTCPVENVSWWDALAYANALSKKEGLETCYRLDGCSGAALGKGCKPGVLGCKGDDQCSSVSFRGRGCKGYRLPTEAEWEVAARAGSTGARNGGPEDVAWYDSNSGGMTHPVREKRPNAWGFYDLLGNVWEWCWDWYGDYGSVANDPQGPSTGSSRVSRGGSWSTQVGNVRSAARYGISPGNRDWGLGFRLCRTE